MAKATTVLVEEKVLNDLKKQMTTVLSRYNKKTETGIDALINAWFKAKKPLIEMLSKHPLWNPEKLMIQFDADYSREFNYRAIYDFVRYIRGNLYNKYNVSYDFECSPADQAAINLVNKIKTQFFEDDANLVDYINNANNANENFKLRTNMKSSKAIGKIANVLEWDKFPNWNREYARLCDAINPIKTKRHTCISLNPIDFLLMSNGNSWSSCHTIRYGTLSAGCYTSGTISYMIDASSFIFYTVDASYDGKDMELQKKLQRQVFGYKPNVLLQSRLYPQNMDYAGQDIYKDIREIVQKVISDCLDIPNMWVRKTGLIEKYVRKTTRSTAYPDYQRSRSGDVCSVSIHKTAVENKVPLKKIMMGRPPICLKCGNKHSAAERLYCRNCN